MSLPATDEQREVAALARRVFADGATPERVKAVAASAERWDRELWGRLIETGLLGLVVPPEHGGAGLGIAELVLVLEEQGRHVAPVPLWPTLALGALPIAELGTDAQRAAVLPGVVAGTTILTAALPGAGASEPALRASRAADGSWRLDGRAASVPMGRSADAVVCAALLPGGAIGIFLLDPRAAGVATEPVETTAHQPVAHLTLDGAPVEPLGDLRRGAEHLRRMLDRAHLGVAALQLGVAEGALRHAARHVAERRQFGRAVGSFQAVAHQAADAYIDVEALRATVWQAAGRLHAGQDPGTAVLVARWWASEAGDRVVFTVQHLHAGLGSDVDYPVHRHFLWGRELSQTLGGAPAHLARLGDLIAERIGGAGVDVDVDGVEAALLVPPAVAR